MSLFNGIKWPYATMQQLNLDWLLDKVRKLTDFLPDNGSTGDLLVRSEDGAAWETPEDALADVLTDTGWIDIPNTAVHCRKKNGYVVVAFDGSSATSFSGSDDWEIVAQLPAGFRPDTFCFSTLGAGPHFSTVIGSGYLDANGNVGVFFPQQTSDIAGYIMFPVSE